MYAVWNSIGSQLESRLDQGVSTPLPDTGRRGKVFTRNKLSLHQVKCAFYEVQQKASF